MKWRLLVLCLIANSCSSDSGCRSRNFSIGFGIETGSAVSHFEMLRDRYFVRHLLYNPVTSTYLGADGYTDVLQSANGALKDYSEAALSRELAFYKETQRELQGLSPDTLPPNVKVDHRVMDAQLKFLIRQIEVRKYHQRAVDTYVTEPFRGIDWHVQQMQDAGNGLRGTEQEWELLLQRVLAIPGYLDHARAHLSDGRRTGNAPDWRMIERNGVNASLASVDYFSRTLTETATASIGNRPFSGALLPRLKEAGERAGTAWKTFAEFLRSTYGDQGKTDRFAAGTEEYRVASTGTSSATREAPQSSTNMAANRSTGIPPYSRRRRDDCERRRPEVRDNARCGQPSRERCPTQ